MSYSSQLLNMWVVLGGSWIAYSQKPLQLVIVLIFIFMDEDTEDQRN